LSSVASARSLTRPLDLAGARAALLGFSAAMLLAVLLAAATSFAIGVANEGRVLPGVRVGDIALGGLDRDAVTAKLAAGLPALTDSAVTLTGSGDDLTLWRSDLGRAYDIGAMVDAAFGTGRGDNPALSVVARLRDTLSGTTVPPVVREYDPALLDWLVLKVVVAHTSDPVNASVRRGPNGKFTVVRAHIGSRLDAGVVRRAVTTALARGSGQDLRIAIPVTPRMPAITTSPCSSTRDLGSVTGFAPRSTARRNAFLASSTQSAMSFTPSPCLWTCAAMSLSGRSAVVRTSLTLPWVST